jgi:hypothetical protein
VIIMMDDLLKGLMSGADSQPGTGQADDDPLADMLGGLMGGGSEPGGADAGDLLEAFMGGGSSQGAGGMGDLLGALMGGGSANAGASALLAPMTDALAKKLGLPPEIAQMVLTFAITRLLSGGKRGGASAGQGGLDLDDLMVRAASNDGIDTDYIQSTGMADELAQQTGLDSDTAARSLQEALQMMGGQMGGTQGSQKQGPSGGSGLDDLLGSR